LRLDDGQFALRSFQPRASWVRNVQALVVYSALCRRYPVSCALQIGDGVLARLWPRFFLGLFACFPAKITALTWFPAAI
jgi:hypothetical protein